MARLRLLFYINYKNIILEILLVLLDAIDDGEHEVVRKICLLQKKSQKKNVGTLEASSELLGCGAD